MNVEELKAAQKTANDRVDAANEALSLRERAEMLRKADLGRFTVRLELDSYETSKRFFPVNAPAICEAMRALALTAMEQQAAALEATLT